MNDENRIELEELLRVSPAPTPRPRARAVIAILAVLSYATVFALTCASVAFMNPDQRHDWAPALRAALFPVGEITYALSQLAGGFLTAAAGLNMGNLGAAVPLFVIAFVIGVAHGALFVAAILGIRWVVRRLGRSRGQM